MSRCASLVSSSISTSRYDCIECPDAVDGPVSDANSSNSTADPLTVHDQISSEILDEKGAVVSEGSSEKGVQHSVTRTVSHRAGAVGLLWIHWYVPFP